MMSGMVSFAVLAFAAYTNHAGVAVCGIPVDVDLKSVTLAENVVTNAAGAVVPSGTVQFPLSIFPDSEKRRIVADFAARTGDIGKLRIPKEVRIALEANDKAIRRSLKRAEKGLCTEKESKEFVERTRAARKAYLDKAVEDGLITPSERELL